MAYRFRRAASRLVLSCLFVFLCAAPFARADSALLISEIMYDPKGSDSNREWVEIYNPGPSSLDLAGHFFLTDGLASAKHSLVAQGAGSIPAGGYAVIVQDANAFRVDHPSYSGAIFDSSWSGLSASSGKTLIVIDASGSVLDQVTYNPALGGANDGNSLQKNASGAWAAAAPTPGAAAESVTPSEDSGSSETTTSGDISISVPTPKLSVVSYDSIRAELLMPKKGITRIPVFISAKALGYSGDVLPYGSFRIVFGDGSEKLSKPFEVVEYAYEHPGSYVVSFEYRENPFSKNPSATARATIEIARPSVQITRVSPDDTITLANPGSDEADLSGWSLTASGEVGGFFRIPSGTILLPDKTILLPARVTGIALTEGQTLTLAYPSGETWMSYSREPAPPLAPEVPVPQQIPVLAAPGSNNTSMPAVEEKNASVALAANVVGATEDTVPFVSKKKKRSLVPFLIALAAIVGGGMYVLRNFDFIDWRDVAKKDGVPENKPASGAPESDDTAHAADRVRIVEE